MEGLTYERGGFNLGLFNKRVGDERVDNGQYHNQAIVPEFSSLGAYVNYTVRGRSMFDQTKIRLSATNLMDDHNVQSNSLTASPLTTTIPGTSLTDQFRTLGPTPVSGQDTPSLMAGRSFSVSVTFGLSPEGKGKK
jgi:iron complex outermembrane receptor protein